MKHQPLTIQMKATAKFFHVFQFITFFSGLNHKPLSLTGRTVIYSLLN